MALLHMWQQRVAAVAAKVPVVVVVLEASWLLQWRQLQALEVLPEMAARRTAVAA